MPDRLNRHQGRVELAVWWEQLLRGAGKIKLAFCGGREYNLDSLQRYVLQQAGSSIRTYLEVFGADDLVKRVKNRPLSQAQLDLLSSAQHVELPDEGVN